MTGWIFLYVQVQVQVQYYRMRHESANFTQNHVTWVFTCKNLEPRRSDARNFGNTETVTIRKLLFCTILTYVLIENSIST